MDHSKFPMDQSSMDSAGPVSGIKWDDEMPERGFEVCRRAAFQREPVDQLDFETKSVHKDHYFQRSPINASDAASHPVHGQRFVVAAIDRVPAVNLVWKDTTLLPAGSRVDLILEISNPGNSIALCHISEHMEANMNRLNLPP